MNKILIVGHESTQYKKLEEILQSYGMLKPALSYTHKMTAQQIGEQISQAVKTSTNDRLPTPKKTTTKRKTKTAATNNAKNIPTLSSNATGTKYNQKHPKKIWDALAFDLILANTGQDLWGWSDSNAVTLLDYWANLDEDMVFVLTYDRPHVLIENLVKTINMHELTDEIIYKALEDWCDYNKELLDFYHKYPERCILVNGEQVVYSAQHYIDSVAKKIMWQPRNVDETQLQLMELNSSQKNQTVRFFVDQLLSNNHNLITIFGLLQESASIPWDNSISVYNQLDLLKCALKEQMELASTKHSLIDMQQTYSLKERDWQTQLDMHKKSHQQDKRALDDASQMLDAYQKENKLVVTQLHQAQEELERYYLDNQKSQEKLKLANQETQKAEQVASEYKEQLEQLTQSKQTLEKQLQKQKISTDVQQENQLLIAQLHQVQEELEKYYLENQYLKAGQEKPNQPTKPMYYGAADRVKQDLPYRLGSTMVSHSKSTKDLAKLPFALAQEYRVFQKQQSTQDELPPVEEYQDSHEAEKVKKHLSYRLGKTLVDSMKSPKELLGLPTKLGREMVGFAKK